MTEVSRITLAVDSRSVRTASADLDKLSAAGKRTEQATEGAQRAFAGLKSVLGGLAIADIGRRVVEQADAYANLNARLRLVTRTSTEFITAQRELFAISQQTGTGLQATTDLFGSLARSTEALGVSQSEVLGVTQTINQALAVSGTSAGNAAAALVQLGQGFASGTLRGEELNSVLEQAPRLARAIADGLGVSVGQLRQLGQEGQLTGEKVFQALQKSAGAIKQEFGQLPLTVGRASTEAGNALLRLIGTIDSTSKATNGLAETIQGAAGFFTELADEIRKVSEGQESLSLIANAFVTATEAVKILGANVKFVFGGVGREVGAIAAQIVALGRLDIQGFNAISEAVKEDARRARAELDAFERRVLNRTPLPDLGQTDSRELARRGRVAPAFGTPAVTPTPTRTGTRARSTREPERPFVGPEIPDSLKNALSQIERTDVVKIAALREELQQLLSIKASGSGGAGIDEAIQSVNEELDKLNPSLQAANAAQAELVALLGDTPSARIEEAQRQVALLVAELDKTADPGRQQRIREAIDAVGERAGFNATTAVAEIEKVDKFTEQASENIQRALGQELANVLDGNFKNIGDSFTRTINRMVAEALAADINRALFGNVGKGGGLFNSIIDFGASLFGGSSGGGINGGSILPNSLRGGRASGGTVSAGGLYPINERGAEILSIGSKDYLTVGGQGGKVTPIEGGGQSVNVNNYFTVGANTDRRTQDQIAASAGAGVQRALARNT